MALENKASHSVQNWINFLFLLPWCIFAAISGVKKLCIPWQTPPCRQGLRFTHNSVQNRPRCSIFPQFVARLYFPMPRPRAQCPQISYNGVREATKLGMQNLDTCASSNISLSRLRICSVRHPLLLGDERSPVAPALSTHALSSYMSNPVLAVFTLDSIGLMNSPLSPQTNPAKPFYFS